LHRACFRDGLKTWAVTIKDDVSVSPLDGGALFRFTNFSQASMRLRRSPLAKDLPFNAESLPKYREAADQLLSAAAEAVEKLEPTENVFPINRWKSWRFVYNYRVAGLSYQESVTFLVLDDGAQIIIHTGAQRKDFELVAARADDIMRRWHEMIPGDETGLN
jgi:hypothetical protein